LPYLNLLQSLVSSTGHLVGLFILTLILIPIIYQHFTLTQVTVLATKSQPVIIIQNRGNTLLINGEEPATARYTVLPFLRQEGINQIQGAITVNNSAQFSTTVRTYRFKKLLLYPS